jgi:ubiquinone/menaquinone biosynthesis C-methylase UbiE
MMQNNKNNEEIKTFWNSRADLGFAAGSRDIILKKLEIEAIAAYVRDGMHVLDVGCGNGITIVELARRYKISSLGIDNVGKMVDSAVSLAANQQLKGSARFQTGDARDLSGLSERFDLIYTERMLINLADWPSQSQAIINICDLLVEGGLYVMCESSQDGLNKINSLRGQLGLSEITPPWHNRYLHDDEIEKLAVPGVKLEGNNDFSSTYYFLSRLVNAWLAAQEGKEPEYESPINQLALKLPPIGNMGQTRIWLWRKVKRSKV